MVIVNLQLLGWQSLSSLLVHRIVRIVYLYLVLLDHPRLAALQAAETTLSHVEN